MVLYRTIDLPLRRIRTGSLGGLLRKRWLINRLLNSRDPVATRVRDLRILSIDQNPRPSDITTLEQVVLRLKNLRDFRYDLFSSCYCFARPLLNSKSWMAKTYALILKL